MKRRSVALLAVAIAASAATAAFAATMNVSSHEIVAVTDAFTVATVPEAPTGTNLYLKTSTPGQNVASSATLPLSTIAPTETTLFNYDTNRDAAAGLLIAKGQSQRWLVAGPFTTTGGTFTFWSQMKDGANNKVGSVQATLRACNANLNVNSCAVMATATITSSGAWHTTNAVWVEKTMTFPTFAGHNLENDTRRLVLDVSVLSGSGDDMWFAYDTTGFPSRLVIE